MVEWLVESVAWLALVRQLLVLGSLPRRLAAVGQHELVQLELALGILGLLVAEEGVAVEPSGPVVADPK